MENCITENIRRLYHAFRFSLRGLKVALLNELSFRLEIICLIFIIPAGLFIGKTGLERALLIGSWVLVIIFELLNSAIERIVDRIGLEENTLSEQAKDLGSSSVFAAIILAGIVWLLIIVN